MPTDPSIESVAHGIGRLQRLLASRRVFDRLATSTALDLSQQSTQVLLALGDAPQSVAEAAVAANMDVGAVSRQLKLLEAAGLTMRAASPTHGRIVLVRRSAAGRGLANRIRDVRSGHLSDALASWTDDERRQLGDLLDRLVDDLQATPYRQNRSGRPARTRSSPG